MHPEEMNEELPVPHLTESSGSQSRGASHVLPDFGEVPEQRKWLDSQIHP